MAQSTVPVYLTGKVGSIVYTANRQGTAVRMLVTPKNPSTPGQSAQRARFTTAAQAFKGLTASVQLAWKSFASTLKNNLSAFNAYVKVAVTAQLVGNTPPTTPPTSVSIPPVTFTGTPPLTASLASGGAHPRNSAFSSWKWYYPRPSVRPSRKRASGQVLR